MNYRKLGNTGLTVSEIGMGCEGFVDKNYEQVKEFLDIMEEGGVNCIDLYSPDPQVRSHLGRALQGRRERLCAAGASLYRMEGRAIQADA